MPIVVSKSIKKFYVYYNFGNYYRKPRFLIDINEIYQKYRHMLKENTVFRVYLSRIFNEDGKVVSEPRRFEYCPFVLAKSESGRYMDAYPQAYGKYIDMDDVANELSVPDGYFLEVLILSLANRNEVKALFPYETKLVAENKVLDKTKEKLDALGKIGAISQSHVFLSHLGLKDIAEDLSRGYICYEKGDYDGAIKAYRKVVEGYRNYFRKKKKDGKKVYQILLDKSESRTEKFVNYLDKTYSLLSNFGEHYGTRAFYEEGIFTNRIVEGLTEYLTKKLKCK